MREILIKDMPQRPSRTTGKYNPFIKVLQDLPNEKALELTEKDFAAKLETLKQVFYKLKKTKQINENFCVSQRKDKLYFWKESPVSKKDS